MQPFRRDGYGPKIWRGCSPLGERELGPHLTQCGQGRGLPAAKFQLDPSNRLATIHQRHRQTDRTGQDRTGQTDNGPIAEGEPFYKLSLKNGHVTVDGISANSLNLRYAAISTDTDYQAPSPKQTSTIYPHV